jgi:uncharacterized membrane protein
MSNSRSLKWIAGLLELYLAIPIIGGTTILAFGWTPLLVMLVIHTVGIMLATDESRMRTGHIVGFIASILGFIPFIGMLLHLVTATRLIFEAATNN